VALICWLFGGAGMIYGSGAFAAVHMVDHGATAHFVFLTFVIGSVVVFPGGRDPDVRRRAVSGGPRGGIYLNQQALLAFEIVGGIATTMTGSASRSPTAFRLE